METQRQNVTTSIGLLILRLGVGGYMLTHGWGKLQMLLAGEFDKFGDPIGLGKELSLVGVVAAEFVCALLVVFGLGTRPAAAVTVFAMAVAAFVVHANDPWTMGAGASKEPALLYLIPFLALVFTGAGRLSLDYLVWSRWRERRAATTR
jgi:putative oxidoreductase